MFREGVDDVLELYTNGISDLPPRDGDGNIDLRPTYAHLTVIKRIDVLERVNSRGLDTRLSKEWEDAQGGAVTMADGSLYDARLFLNWGMGGN